MEVSRKRSQATKVVFPLINAASATQYYTTSAWTSMTNASKSVYLWSDDASAPTSSTIAANPIQLGSTGKWYLVISASEISASSDYMSIKLKSDQVLEQTILIRITNYDASIDTVSSPLTISAYQNFPQVTVSAINGGLFVGTSAYLNHPQVTVSAINGGLFVGTSAYLNHPQVTVSANLDKTNYTVSSGSITAVAGNVTGSVGSVTGNVAGTVNGVVNSVSVSAQTNHPIVAVSAYTNFPQVTVSAINGGLFVGTSAYTNFPSVNVSSVTDGSITSADYAIDYWNKIGIGTPVSLNGGTSTIAGMLQQIADGSTGSTFISANSLKGIYNQIVSNNASSLTANGGSVIGGTNLSGSYLNTSANDGSLWKIQTSGTVPLSASLTFNLGTRVPSTISIYGYLQAGTPTNAGIVNVHAYNYITSAYELISNASTAILNGTSNSTYSYVLNSTTHVNSTGNSQILFVAGRTNTNDILNLDYVIMNAVAAGTSVTDIANAVYNKMGMVVYDNGIWIDTINGFSGTTLGVNGISTYPSNNLANALNLAQQINLKRFYLKPDSSIVLVSAYDAWRFIGRAIIGLNGQSIADASFENVEWISGTSVGQDYVMDDCAIGDVTLDSGSIHNSEFNGTFTTCANGVYVFKRCIDANPAGLASPTFVCTPSATMAFRDYRGGIQFNNMISSNSIKLDGAGRVVIASSCSGGDLTLRGFWQVTNNGTGVIITSSARYDNTIPVTVSAYQNFPQVYVSGGNINNVINPITVSAYQNFPQVYVSANGDKTNYTVSSGIINTVTNPVIVSAYQNFPQVQVSSTTVPLSADLRQAGGTALTATQVVGGRLSVSVGNMANNVITSNAVTDGALTSAEFGANYWTRVQLGLATSDVQTTVNQISADTGAILTDTNEIQSKLPVGQIASQTDVASIIQNTRFVAAVPTEVIVPISGSQIYEIKVYFYNMSGTMENPDGEIAIEANSVRQIIALTEFYNDISGSVHASISPTFSGDYYAMTSAGVGVWQTYYKFATSAFVLPDEIVIDFALKENTKELHYGRVITVYAQAPGTMELANTNINKDVIARAVREFDASTISIGTNSVEKTIENVSREEKTVSAYSNFPQVTVSANLDKINYTVSSGTVSTVTNPVTVGTNNDKTGYSLANSVTVSAYTNFPQVTVSAINGGLFVGTSAYQNFPQVQVSAGTVNSITNPVIVSGYQNFPQVTVSANLDKINYTVSSGTINNITNPVIVSAYQNFPRVQVSGVNGGLYIGTSAYTNFPQVSVSANLDKTNYTVSSGTINNVINPITVSAYQNFPQVQVSGINSGIEISATTIIDYVAIKNASISAIEESFVFNGSAVEAYSVNEIILPGAVIVSAYQNFPQVQVSGINTGVYGSVSAYQNMPQVTVSANLDKMNYTVISGTVNNVTNAVVVSAYQNFPSINISGTVQVSGGTINNVINPTIVSAYQNFPQVQVSAGTVNSITNPVIVSGYQNFPQVQISGINNGVYGSVSAYQNFPEVIVSAFTSATKIDMVNGVWDEELTIAKHNINNSSGKKLRELSVAVGGTTIYSGVVISATSNSITLDSSAASYSGAYDPSLIAIVGGIGAGQSRLILEYNGSNHIALVDRDWKIIPDSSSDFIIYAHPGREHVNEGRVTAGTLSSISLNQWASDFDDVYIGQLIFLRSGYGQDQVGLVTAYDGSTHTAYINHIWKEIPDTTTGYVILPNHIHTSEYDASAVWNSTIAYKNFPSVNISSVDYGIVASLSDLSATSAGIIEHGDTNWSLSSTIDEISASCIIAIQDQFTFNSPGIVNSFVSGGVVSADPNTIIAALLSTTVDGKTFEELMEILLAMATGRITRINNKFTYYKQDNTTALYTLESERSERTRL